MKSSLRLLGAQASVQQAFTTKKLQADSPLGIAGLFAVAAAAATGSNDSVIVSLMVLRHRDGWWKPLWQPSDALTGHLKHPFFA